jgi:transposase
MTLYLVGSSTASPAPPSGDLPCRCCPGGVSRSSRRRVYPSDMTDAEWALIEPMLPAPAWLAGRGGRPAEHCRRDVVDAIRYLVKEGITWRAMPIDLPPWSTVYDYVAGWQASGATAAMHDQLRDQVRVAAGRRPEPTAAITDSQSVRAAETVARVQRGYDAGKKVNGRKRHIAVDVLGLLLAVLVTPAGVQDRDGGRDLLWRLRAAHRRIRLVWADGGYAGQLVSWAAHTLRVTLQIVKRTDKHAGFVVLPRRWVVERTFSWITRYRRTVRDYERLPQHHETMIYWSMVTLMGRRLARAHRPPASTPAPALRAVA